MGFTVEPLDGQQGFGAQVIGLSPDDIGDTATREALFDLWIDKGLLVFRDMTGLDTHIRLSEVFGEPEEHPLLRGVDQPREHKLIIDLEYDDSIGDIFDVEGELLGAWLPWHSDLVYLDTINRGGILRPITIPGKGGETGFIDQIAAWDALPERLKAAIEDKEVVYMHAVDASLMKFARTADRCLRLHPFQARTREHPSVQNRVIHPAVYIQQETGRKVLNVSPWFAEGIVGMESEEGDAMLREVIEHIVRSEAAYFHSWREGDMVLWDNWRMLHCAAGIRQGEKRHMRRTTIAGDYKLGRKEDPDAVFADELRVGM